MTMRIAPPVGASEEMEKEAIRAWHDLLAVTPRTVREAVAEVVRNGAETLTEEFYERMMRSGRASGFLDQARVQKRLRASLRQWMVDLFFTVTEDAVAATIRRQVEVGAVHARIRLPIDLIPSGIRILKRGFRWQIDFAPL
jgi:diguanylate cyclase